MSISFRPYIHDATRNLWSVPPLARQSPGDLELNVNNANGADLLFALGLDPDVSVLPMPIDLFGGLVAAALRRHLDQRSPELKTILDRQPGKLSVVRCGRREGYIEERLRELATLVQQTRQFEATHFGWG